MTKTFAGVDQDKHLWHGRDSAVASCLQKDLLDLLDLRDGRRHVQKLHRTTEDSTFA